MKLYEIPRDSKLYGFEPAGIPDGVILFRHIDGMYSLCAAYSGDPSAADTEYLGLCHLAAWTPLEPHLDGYRLGAEE